MLNIILLYSSLALMLLLGLFKDSGRQYAKRRAKTKPTRRWLRCCICGSYQNTTSDYCLNHDLPTYMLYVSERQQRRIDYHIGYLCTHYTIESHQDDFIAFAMRLEDVTKDDWNTESAISLYEEVGPASLLKFADFLLALEEATSARLDIDDVVTQYLVSEVMDHDQTKVAQN